MNGFVLFFALLTASPGLAAVTIRPGQSITVEPDTRPTVVSCTPTAGSAASSAGSGAPGASGALNSSRSSGSVASSGAFCYCRPSPLESTVDFKLTKFTLGGDGQRMETNLKSYASSAACDKAIASYAACR